MTRAQLDRRQLTQPPLLFISFVDGELVESCHTAQREGTTDSHSYRGDWPSEGNVQNRMERGETRGASVAL